MRAFQSCLGCLFELINISHTMALIERDTLQFKFYLNRTHEQYFAVFFSPVVRIQMEIVGPEQIMHSMLSRVNFF